MKLIFALFISLLYLDNCLEAQDNKGSDIRIIPEPVKIINKFVSDDSESNIAALILSKFEITKNEKDWVNNDDLGLFCAAHNISLTYKLKPLLKSWGCKDFKSGKRGLNFLKVIVEKVDDITENK